MNDDLIMTIEDSDNDEEIVFIFFIINKQIQKNLKLDEDENNKKKKKKDNEMIKDFVFEDIQNETVEKSIFFINLIR